MTHFTTSSFPSSATQIQKYDIYSKFVRDKIKEEYFMCEAKYLQDGQKIINCPYTANNKVSMKIHWTRHHIQHMSKMKLNRFDHESCARRVMISHYESQNYNTMWHNIRQSIKKAQDNKSKVTFIPYHCANDLSQTPSSSKEAQYIRLKSKHLKNNILPRERIPVALTSEQFNSENR